MSYFVLRMLASVAAGLAIYLFVYHIMQRSWGIPIEDEWKLRARGRNTKELVLYSLLGMLACFVAGYSVTGKLHLAGAAGVAGIFAGRALACSRERKRRELLQAQYVQVLGTLISALQGGLSPYQALEDATPSMPSPAREVFTEILRRVRTNLNYVEAVESVAKETGWQELDSLVTALRIYHETGCNLVDVFRHLQENVIALEADRRYVEAVTSEIRITARLLSVLPFFLMGVSRVMAPEFISPLFDTTAGNLVIFAVVGTVIFGNILVNKMVSSAIKTGK